MHINPFAIDLLPPLPGPPYNGTRKPGGSLHLFKGLVVKAVGVAVTVSSAETQTSIRKLKFQKENGGIRFAKIASHDAP